MNDRQRRLYYFDFAAMPPQAALFIVFHCRAAVEYTPDFLRHD